MVGSVGLYTTYHTSLLCSCSERERGREGERGEEGGRVERERGGGREREMKEGGREGGRERHDIVYLVCPLDPLIQPERTQSGAQC